MVLDFCWMILCRISSDSAWYMPGMLFDPEDGSSSSETQVNYYHTTSRHVPKDDQVIVTTIEDELQKAAYTN
jgi:hypothetical protein